MIYLDASALVKLVVLEPESDALIALIRAWPDRLSSALSLAEVQRALRRERYGGAERRRAQRLFARLALVEVDRRILTAAAALDPPELRTLDAIHLATALAVGEDLRGLVTYDRRLAAAAERVDLEVLAPA
ncbi:MAG: type II toxin-antitoxin system VapC family toxin [Candidatus Rokuibacteriota bacterium]